MRITPRKEASRLSIVVSGTQRHELTFMFVLSGTFQERVLSKRCLIFTDGKVYLQCRSTIMREDIYTEEASAGRSIDFLHGPVQHYTELDRHPIDVYKYSISLYTSRFLTKEQDILAAFSGIW